MVFNVLVGCSAKWLANVVDIITNPARVKTVVIDNARMSNAITSAGMWEETLEKMRNEMGMFKWAGKDRRAWGRFFLVPKADGSGRAVLDLAAFSKMCFRPPPVNLPGISGLLRRIGRWQWKSGFGYSVDLRHMFFQIPVGPHLANFFTVRCRRKGGHTYQSNEGSFAARRRLSKYEISLPLTCSLYCFIDDAVTLSMMKIIGIFATRGRLSKY